MNKPTFSPDEKLVKASSHPQAPALESQVGKDQDTFFLLFPPSPLN